MTATRVTRSRRPRSGETGNSNMRKRRGPQGPDIRNVKPTRIVMDLKMTIDGGTVGTSQELSEVWTSVMRAFQGTAHRLGLGFAWVGEISCVTAKRMDARIARSQLNVREPSPLAAQPQDGEN